MDLICSMSVTSVITLASALLGGAIGWYGRSLCNAVVGRRREKASS